MNPRGDIEEPEAAQRLYRNLVEELGTRALWFVRKDVPLDLTSPSAGLLLDRLAAHGSRSQWIQVQKLKKWRSQRTR